MLMKCSRNPRKALGESFLFARLAPEHLAELARASRSTLYHKGQLIYRTGDPVSELYILLSGQVTLALSCNRGNEKVIDVVEPGCCFGEAELFGVETYRVSATAVVPALVLGIGRESLFRVMAADPRISLRLMEVLAERQIEMEAEFATRRFCSNGQRLLDYMLRLAGPKRDLVGETTVTLNTSKKVLASRFDMKPETLSRTLRDLTAAGLIAVDGSAIRLRNTSIARYLDDEALPQALNFPGMRRAQRSVAGSGARLAPAVPTAPVLIRPEVRSCCDSINMAGRQRMLSQRMAKSWLMLERRLLCRESRFVLKQSVKLFDRQLEDLDRRVISDETAAAFAELAALWPDYRALLEADPCHETALQLFDITEDVLQAAQRLTLSFEHADGTPKGMLVNMAGRERMLSQRMAKLFMFQHLGINAAECRQELGTMREEFSAALDELIAGARSQPALLEELESVAEQWKVLRATMTIGGAPQFAPAARRVFTSSETLLRHMDSAVDLYVRLPA